MEDIKFEKQNVFGKGTENTAYAKYFVGKSYLNPLTSPKNQPFFANVTFERVAATTGTSTAPTRAADRYFSALRAAAGIRNGESLQED